MPDPVSRVNSNGLLEILQPDTNAYVQAVALIQLASGFNVALKTDQAALLTGISTNSGFLPQILAHNQSISSGTQTILNSTSGIQTILQNTTNPGLTAINTSLAGVQSANTSMLTQLLALNNSVTNSVIGPLASISSNTLNYSSQITSILNSLTNLNNLAGANSRPSTPAITTRTLNVSDQEVSYLLPTNTKLLMFKCRRNSSSAAFDLRYSFTANTVNTLASTGYRTLEAYNEYREEFGGLNGTLYLASTAAGAGNVMTIEVEVWF